MAEFTVVVALGFVVSKDFGGYELGAQKPWSVLCWRLAKELRDHILMTMDKLGPHAGPLGASSGIHLLRSSVELSNNDARWLRELQSKENLLAEVIRQASLKFRGLPV